MRQRKAIVYPTIHEAINARLIELDSEIKSADLTMKNSRCKTRIKLCTERIKIASEAYRTNRELLNQISGNNKAL